MRKQLTGFLATLAVLAPLSSVPAFAADTGGDAVPTCKKGTVYDKKSQKCVPKTSDGSIDDDSLYSTGRQLALNGDYAEAINVLSLAANKSDPKILTYLGYSHRKMGRVLVGVGYYEEALRVDPNFAPVREYLGEAHLQRGDVASAKQQLAEIGKRNGTTCEEYAELSKQIEAFRG